MAVIVVGHGDILARHIAELVVALGVDRVLMGSGYPHAEGVAEPVQFLDALAGLGPVDVEKIMRGNALALLGLD